MTQAPKELHFYYGWTVILVLSVLSMYTSDAVTYGFTAIFVPIADEFGWSYTQISLAASLRGIEASLLAPIIGATVDRLGPRRLLRIHCPTITATPEKDNPVQIPGTGAWFFIQMGLNRAMSSKAGPAP